MDKIKYGKVEVPDSDFQDENVTALVSMRLPLKLIKSLKRLSLTPEFEGRYQTLAKVVLEKYVDMADRSHKTVEAKVKARVEERRAKKQKQVGVTTRKVAAKAAQG